MESVNRDMSSFKLSACAGRNMNQMVLGIYSFVREMISERVIRDLRSNKLGGAGMQVWLDTYKLNLRTNSGVDEFWIVGII